MTNQTKKTVSITESESEAIEDLAKRSNLSTHAYMQAVLREAIANGAVFERRTVMVKSDSKPNQN